jgi:hypothetical protein
MKFFGLTKDGEEYPRITWQGQRLVRVHSLPKEQREKIVQNCLTFFMKVSYNNKDKCVHSALLAFEGDVKAQENGS